MENHNQFDDLSHEVQVAIKNHELFPTIPSDFIKDECRLWDEKAPDHRQDQQAANARYKGNELLDQFLHMKFASNDSPFLPYLLD